MHTTRELLIKTDAVALSGAELNTGVSLSPRGKEVLELFMNGYTYQQTASQLGISVSCVRRYCERMLWKNNCKSMLELIAKYHTPLRERIEDMPANLEYELVRLGVPRGKKVWMNSKAKNLFLDFAQSKETTWPGNLRDFSSAVVRMGTLSSTGEITETIVSKEISRLKVLWNETTTESSPEMLSTLGICKSQFDNFDLHTLDAVIKICKTSRTLSEAGRLLFNVSRHKKKKANDATRLREYLNRFGLDFTAIKQQSAS